MVITPAVHPASNFGMGQSRKARVRRMLREFKPKWEQQQAAYAETHLVHPEPPPVEVPVIHDPVTEKKRAIRIKRKAVILKKAPVRKKAAAIDEPAKTPKPPGRNIIVKRKK